jgi:hypothetical protein
LKTLDQREFGGLIKSPSSRFSFSKPLAWVSVLLICVSCSLFKTRPVQEMSDTAAALKAAKEAQADVIAPVLYREANEWWTKAKAEYKYKNFEAAENYAIKARKLAEQAEFEAIKNPSQRTESSVDTSTSTPTPDVSPSPYAYPSPTPTPYDRAIQNPNGGSGGSDNSSPTHIQVPSPTTP